jgi:hypothetical protein
MTTDRSHRVVGVWEVTAAAAPFAYHVMTFHSDGTVLQSNPDWGNRHSSDSCGMGIWHGDGADVTAQFVEYTVSRADPAVVRRGIVEIRLEVGANEFTGTARTAFQTLSGDVVGASSTTSLRGVRFR